MLHQSTPLNAIPKLHHQAQRQLNWQEKDLMVEWAATNRKAVRQRNVRQETTMFKAGTLPLNMYRSSDYPKDKVSFDTDMVEKESVISAMFVTLALSAISHEPIEMGQAEEINEEARLGDEDNEDVGVDKEEYDRPFRFRSYYG